MAAESTLEAKARAFALKNYCLTFKFVSPGCPGVPDRIFIGPTGKTLFIEFKAPGAKPRPLQSHWLNKLRAQGVRAEWCDNLEEAKRMILELCD